MLFLSLYGFFFKFLYAFLQIFISMFKLFQLTTTEKRTDLCHECGFSLPSWQLPVSPT